MLISTRLFGTAPENDLSTIFQQVLGENLPPAMVAPLNDYVQSFGSVPLSSESGNASGNLAVTTPDFPAYNGVDLVGLLEAPFQEGQNIEQLPGGIGTVLQEPVVIDVVSWIEAWFQDTDNAGDVPEGKAPGLKEAAVFDLLGWITYSF